MNEINYLNCEMKGVIKSVLKKELKIIEEEKFL